MIAFSVKDSIMPNFCSDQTCMELHVHKVYMHIIAMLSLVTMVCLFSSKEVPSHCVSGHEGQSSFARIPCS